MIPSTVEMVTTYALGEPAQTPSPIVRRRYNNLARQWFWAYQVRGTALSAIANRPIVGGVRAEITRGGVRVQGGGAESGRKSANLILGMHSGMDKIIQKGRFKTSD